MDWAAVHKVCVKNVIDFDVRTPSIYALADHLSGGNQQKLIVARELSRDVKLVIAVAADARPRRRLDRIHPQAHHRGARRRRRRADRVDRAGRDPRPVRPHPGDVPRPRRRRIRRRAKRTLREIGLAMAGGSGNDATPTRHRPSARTCCGAPPASSFDCRRSRHRAGASRWSMALVLGGVIMLATGVVAERDRPVLHVAVHRLGRLDLRDLRDADGGGAADARRRSGWRSASAPGCSTSAPRGRCSSAAWPRWSSASPSPACRRRIHIPLALIAGGAGRRRMGGHRRLAEGGDRRPRGDHHDHAQPDLVPPRRLSAAQSADPEAGARRPDLAVGAAQRRTAAAAWLARPDAARSMPASCWRWRRSPSSTGCCSAPRSASSSAPAASTPTRRAMPACARA